MAPAMPRTRARRARRPPPARLTPLNPHLAPASPGLQVTLFVNHLGDMDDAALLARCAPHGDVLRAFVVTAPPPAAAAAPDAANGGEPDAAEAAAAAAPAAAGEAKSKGYGFVEFALPAQAKAALRAFEEAYESERKRCGSGRAGRGAAGRGLSVARDQRWAALALHRRPAAAG